MPLRSIFSVGASVAPLLPEKWLATRCGGHTAQTDPSRQLNPKRAGTISQGSDCLSAPLGSVGAVSPWDCTAGVQRQRPEK